MCNNHDICFKPVQLTVVTVSMDSSPLLKYLAGKRAKFCWSSLTLPNSQENWNQCSSKSDMQNTYTSHSPGGRGGCLLKKIPGHSQAQWPSFQIFFMNIPKSKNKNCRYADSIKWNVNIQKLKYVDLLLIICQHHHLCSISSLRKNTYILNIFLSLKPVPFKVQFITSFLIYIYK